MLNHDSTILIVGGGTFGLSTALWLCRNNYRRIVVLDSFDIPSELSAAYDVNKVIQSCYGPKSRFTTMLALEALELWQNDSVFSPHFHETGIIYATCAGDHSDEYEYLVSVDEERRRANRVPAVPLNTPGDFNKVAPQLHGDLMQWKGFFQATECGWVQSKDVLASAASEIKGLGGRFITVGVDRLLYDPGKTRVVGVVTKCGKEIRGDKVVISAGASSVSMLEFENQLLAKCWTVALIKLSEEEARAMKNMPVIVNLELGFFFEPTTNNELKICNEFPGYTNYINSRCSPDDSIPIKKNMIPKEAEDDIRAFLRSTMPQFAERPFVETKICWCTDTPDRNFLICEHPKYGGSLILATGDSGHGFKHMPNIGRYISRLVMYGPAALGEERNEKWKWRPETSNHRSQDRYGGDGMVRDLNDIKDWVSA